VGTLDSVVSSWEGDEEGDGCMLQRLLLLKDVAAGLQVLHANSVVHGDLVSVQAVYYVAATIHRVIVCGNGGSWYQQSVVTTICYVIDTD
jgi:hypothetical protein